MWFAVDQPTLFDSALFQDGTSRVFFSSPLAGKRDIVVTILFGVCACVSASVCPSGFLRTISCTIMHGF